MKFIKGLLMLALTLVLTGNSFAKDMLITNDTGTQGKGHLLVEVNSEFGFNKEVVFDATTREASFGLETIFSYGVTENVDVILGIPYLWRRVEEDGAGTAKENGISDVTVELKWKFYEKDGLSFALKPGLSLPTGDKVKGLGTGKTAYNLFFITTKVIEPLTFDLNLAYTRNENKVDEEKDIWYASLAMELAVSEKMLLIGNAGIQTNMDKTSTSSPAFILGGINYTVTDALSVNLGVKGALNEAETDYVILAGIAWRF
ncbi:MAG: transporter [Nitrospirae bacterium]|nr:transporter [Nitrospirota bacterium]